MIREFPEINILNYDEDQVANLNAWGVEADYEIERLEDAVQNFAALLFCEPNTASVYDAIQNLKDENERLVSNFKQTRRTNNDQKGLFLFVVVLFILSAVASYAGGVLSR